MQCLKCKHNETKVIDSRVLGNCVRRRRQCVKCNYRFTTYENPEPIDLKVVKKDGQSQDFDREKIKKGLERALNKRPFSQTQIDQIACEIELEIYSKYKDTIASKDIGKIILTKLKKIDEIAYVRFASVYKNFKNVNTFYKELNKFNNNKIPD